MNPIPVTKVTKNLWLDRSWATGKSLLVVLSEMNLAIKQLLMSLNDSSVRNPFLFKIQFMLRKGIIV